MKTIRFTEVRDFYKRNQPDGHWFDAGSIRFFKTKLPEIAYETNAGILFITSEVDPSGVKAYSVRRQLPSGEINTVGSFHSYQSRAAAAKAIKALHNGEA
jgi:hypothetical protein